MEDLLRSSNRDPIADGEEVPLLDERGHLTPEAIAFPEEMGVYQRAVVDRHLEICDLCTQQAMTLARARNELISARPAMYLPAGLSTLGRQVARRSLAMARDSAPAPQILPPQQKEARRFWTPSPALAITLLAGLTVALLVAVAALLLGGCNKKGDALPLTVKVSAAVEEARAPGEATAAALSPEGTLAVGLEDGGIVLLSQNGEGKGKPPKPEFRMDGAIRALAFAATSARLVSAAGKAVVLWDVPSKKQLKDVTGPQEVTALTVDPNHETAYFGTDQGHVMRWELSKRGAEAMAGFPCGATGIAPARMQLPPSRRCKFGTYFHSPDGQHACLYPVNWLLVRDGRIYRACREGTFASKKVGGKKTAWFTSGHLSMLTFMPPDRLLLGRKEGKLNVYSTKENKLLSTLTAPTLEPLAGDATEKLLAVAQGGEVRIWTLPAKDPAATIKVPPGLVWLQLTGQRLRYLARDGRVISHKIEVKSSGPASPNPPSV